MSWASAGRGSGGSSPCCSSTATPWCRWTGSPKRCSPGGADSGRGHDAAELCGARAEGGGRGGCVSEGGDPGAGVCVAAARRGIRCRPVRAPARRRGRAAGRGDAVGASASAREALQQWRGAAYAEFADEDWARPEAQRLEEHRLVAHERLVEAELACGRAAEVIPGIESLVDDHPLRETFRAQLVVRRRLPGRFRARPDRPGARSRRRCARPRGAGGDVPRPQSGTSAGI
ncbi:MAG: BTAD domain-containing putative transcriptional regulator [Acidimicrobiales bacterium]